jgi:hypothetical protein
VSRWRTELARLLPRRLRGAAPALCSVGAGSIEIVRPDAIEAPRHLDAGTSLEGLAAALAEILAHADRGESWTVVLDAGLAPLLTLDAAGVTLDAAGWHALATHRFAAMMGSDAAGHEIHVEPYPRRERLAWACPIVLLDALRAAPCHREGRLAVMPTLAHAHGVALGPSEAPRWLVCVTAQTVHAAWLGPERITLAAPAPDSPSMAIADLISRESQWLGLGPQAAPSGDVVYLGGASVAAATRGGLAATLTARDAFGRRL